ncbi:MAG: hypothetical protein J7501_06780 [Bdellovibrio sp.]|nr:hypothetical protein [Bdellovibrio sp.]
MKVSSLVMAMSVLFTGAVSNAAMSPAEISIIVQTDKVVKAAKERVLSLTVQNGKNNCTGLLIDKYSERYIDVLGQVVDFEAHEVCITQPEDPEDDAGEAAEFYKIKGQIVNRKVVLESVEFGQAN